MTRFIVLDSGPLGPSFQRSGLAAADECRAWMRGHLARGVLAVVPKVADYEVRRELLRLGLAAAVRKLNAFVAVTPDRYLPLTTAAMRRAADLWADVRRQGKPTADRRALDGDVILAAQVLASDLDPAEVVVATTNAAHLSRFVPAMLWSDV